VDDRPDRLAAENNHRAKKAGFIDMAQATGSAPKLSLPQP
jgi:hypothetical protein